MPKGERKRRRNPDLQAETGAANPSQPLEGSTGTTPDESSAGAGSPQEGSATQEALSPTRGWPDGSPPRQIALAEILVNPDLVRSTAVPSPAPKDLRTEALANTAETPKREERTAFSQQHETAQAVPVFDNIVAQSPPVESAPSATGGSYAPEHPNPPSPDNLQRWTREPMLVALLLAALLVLIFDTYFTWRLNGLSDRLAIMSGSAAAAGERPWVGVDSMKTAQFASGGQPITTVHIVNSGHDPAYDLRSNTAGSLRAATTPGPSVPAQKGQLAVTALLLPNVGGNLTFFANTRALTPEEAANVRSGQYVLWLTGRLDYRDAHGHPHLTTFRYRYNPALSSFMATPAGNTAN